jgi:vacuolar iron transporter family protein
MSRISEADGSSGPATSNRGMQFEVRTDTNKCWPCASFSFPLASPTIFLQTLRSRNEANVQTLTSSVFLPPLGDLLCVVQRALSRAEDGSASGGRTSPEIDEHDEHVHHSNRAPWLRAFVLGANDGLVSVAALLMGVGAGSKDLKILRLAGTAGMISGALSMALGEYVSVASQRDAEHADIQLELQEQLKGPEAQQRELEELTQIYEDRGLPYDLARQVAETLTEKDVIRAHARDELGIDIDELANPLQAALVSAICFSAGAALPLLSASFLQDQYTRLAAILASTTVGLLIFGILGSWLGGAKIWKGGTRVVVGGLIALAVSYGIGVAFDAPTGG